jgi:hypothetical protein
MPAWRATISAGGLCGCSCEGHAEHGCGRSSEHDGQGFGLILHEIKISPFEGPQVRHGMMQDGERRHVVEDGTASDQRRQKLIKGWWEADGHVTTRSAAPM